jgi:membrane protein
VNPIGRWSDRAREFSRRLWDKSLEDDIFFMAGAIAFNILVAMIPLLLLGVGVTGYALSARVPDPVEATVAVVVEALPQGGGGMDPSALVRGLVAEALERRSGFTILGALFFIWLATRLVGSVRIALREIFDIGQDRGVIRGKIFDAQVVVLAVLLLTVNLGVTILLNAAVQLGVDALSLERPAVGWTRWILGQSIALASIWTLFFTAYRYLPARRIPWRTAWIAATFSAVLHEILKHSFSWYATEIATYTTTWGNLATVAVLFFWIYYGSLVFILGGEVAQVYTMRKARAVQVRDTLGDGMSGGASPAVGP